MKNIFEIPATPIIWRQRFIQIARITLIIALICVTYLSLQPAAPMPSVHNGDKIVHALAYMVLTGLALCAFPAARYRSIFIGLALYGGLIEILQGQVHAGRTMSLADEVANMTGILVTILIWHMIAAQLKIRGKSEEQIPSEETS